MPGAVLSQRLDLRCTSRWRDVSERELRLLIRLVAADLSPENVRNTFMLRSSGLKVVGSAANGRWLVRVRSPTRFLGLRLPPSFVLLSPLDLTPFVKVAEWTTTPPDFPVAPVRGPQRRPHIPLNFMDVPFESFLTAENIWQGFVASKDDFSRLDALVKMLYPGARLPIRKRQRQQWRIAAMFWYSGLKSFLSKMYPDLFAAPSSDDSQLMGSRKSGRKLALEMMNAQIRALTKGDITLEDKVLSIDTHRALAELDAQARENEQLRRQLKN